MGGKEGWEVPVVMLTRGARGRRRWWRVRFRVGCCVVMVSFLGWWVGVLGGVVRYIFLCFLV